MSETYFCLLVRPASSFFIEMWPTYKFETPVLEFDIWAKSNSSLNLNHTISHPVDMSSHVEMSTECFKTDGAGGLGISGGRSSLLGFCWCGRLLLNGLIFVTDALVLHLVSAQGFKVRKPGQKVQKKEFVNFETRNTKQNQNWFEQC